MTTDLHTFERAGLGPAPYRYLGMRRVVHGERDLDGNLVTHSMGGDVLPTKPGSCCDLCSTAMYDEHWFAAADGSRFKIGSSCAKKAGGRDARAVADRMRRVNRARTKKRQDARIAVALEIVADDARRAQLGTEPHPMARRAAGGDTLLDWVEWMLENAGRAGKVKVCRALGC